MSEEVKEKEKEVEGGGEVHHGHVLDAHGLEHLTAAELERRDQERLRNIAQEKQKALDDLRMQQNDEIEKAGVRFAFDLHLMFDLAFLRCPYRSPRGPRFVLLLLK